MSRATLKYIRPRAILKTKITKINVAQDICLQLFYYTLAENFIYLGYLGVLLYHIFIIYWSCNFMKLTYSINLYYMQCDSHGNIKDHERNQIQRHFFIVN